MSEMSTKNVKKIFAFCHLLLQYVLPCYHLGITSIHSSVLDAKPHRIFAGKKGMASTRVKPYLKSGKRFRFLQFVGERLLGDIRESLQDFLSRENTEATIIICEPGTDFVRDLSEIEDRDNATSNRAESLLRK